MKAELVDNMGSDLTVVNAARVSFDKHVEKMGEGDKGLLNYLAKHNHWTPYSHVRYTFIFPIALFDRNVSPNLATGMVLKAEPHYFKVRHSLWGWKELIQGGHFLHGSGDVISTLLCEKNPESCAALGLESSPITDNLSKFTISLLDDEEETDPDYIDVTFRMGAPVPIRTQCFKHKVGFVENEESRRYISSKPSFFIPTNFRKACDNKKQGSGGSMGDQAMWQRLFQEKYERDLWEYEHALHKGLCEEQARFLLPQGTEVHWYWTGSLSAYARFYNLRVDPHAQEETKDLAKEVGDIIAPLYPESWEALTK